MLRRTLVLMSLVLAATPFSAACAEEAIQRLVSGEVTAVDTDASPNTIVVKSKTWKGELLIVGAIVPAETVIRKGKSDIPLSQVKTGDAVDMAYERNHSVVARKITIK